MRRALIVVTDEGELDAVMSARAPKAFTVGACGVVRLFDNSRETERAFFESRRIFAIVNVVAIRRAVLERHPSVATNLFDAFTEARDPSIARLSDITQSAIPLPSVADWVDAARSLFGDDLWPYGIEPNRVTLSAFLRYAAEQGIAHRAMEPEELFTATVPSQVRV